MRVQVVCKHTTTEQLSEQLMVDFGSVERFEIVPRRGHVLVEVESGDYQKNILDCCRRNRFAYLRLIEWESGGSSGDTGGAICVAGSQCEPLRPMTTSEDTNGFHGLFCDREGLLVALAGRGPAVNMLTVVRFTFEKYRLSKRVVAEMEWRGSFEDALKSQPHWYEQWTPLMRATVRKMNCLHCTHIHYQAIEDAEVTDGIQEDACSRR